MRQRMISTYKACPLRRDMSVCIRGCKAMRRKGHYGPGGHWIVAHALTVPPACLERP